MLLAFCRCKPLVEGQRGSLVFVIDAQTGCYYRLGQLIGFLTMPEEYSGPVVYQAVVLSQSLDEFTHRRHQKLKELVPIGQECRPRQTSGSVQTVVVEGEVSELEQSGEPKSIADNPETTEASSENVRIEEIASDNHQVTEESMLSEIKIKKDKSHHVVNHFNLEQMRKQRSGAVKIVKLELTVGNEDCHNVGHLNNITDDGYCMPTEASDF